MVNLRSSLRSGSGIKSADTAALPARVYPGRSSPNNPGSGCVLTIGAFDGVHLGHQQVINQLKEHGERLGLPSAVMTFRPDPAEFFSRSARAALMSWREKMQGLKAAGADQVLCLPFDKKVSEMSAEDFVRELLVNQLGVRFLMVGDDFRFGAGRKGCYELLVKQGKTYGFEVARSETYEVDGCRVSSTRIRESLAAGDMAQAELLLGRPYEICGKVVTGKKLGRTLGFPTANIPVRRRKVALTGVFAVSVQLQNGDTCQAVANLGTRPAVNSLEQPLLEVHLLDFQPEKVGLADLYGQRMRIFFEQRIRDEKNFNGLEELKHAIQMDVQKAREWFNRAR